jgi:hypothetical protein
LFRKSEFTEDLIAHGCTYPDPGVSVEC